MQRILITGGAGFVGSTLALRLREAYPGAEVLCLDNLYRKGSELNRARLEGCGATLLEADVRDRDAFEMAPCDVVIDAAAEPSVLAGRTGDAAYVVDTNLGGTLNVLEAARRWSAAVVFLSTSRVYPVDALRRIRLVEEALRFEVADDQVVPGISTAGIAEDFPLDGARTLYGATKFASEVMVREYAAQFGLRAVVNRCGVLAGPWQMGRVDQGVVALWAAAHHFRKELRYIGYDGKQVRDVLHVEDLADLLLLQLARLAAGDPAGTWRGQVYNVGGGRPVSFSLRELTALCREATGAEFDIGTQGEVREGDVPLYVTDASKAQRTWDWLPRRTAGDVVKDTVRWLRDNEDMLRGVFGVG